MSKLWKVAIYARVSSDKKDQQESIPAQVQSLKEWLLEKSKMDSEDIYTLVEVYEDAGSSGSNFERESFIKMKTDIELGKINMIVTRDLSRFSRNYITAGYYLEEYFKINGIRFISVLDNVDTQEEVNDIIPFKNILNEMYIKDCSRRTKDGLKQRMLRGSCIASKPPYGYRFTEEWNGNIKTIQLVYADNESTEVVREIFNLYLGGWGFGRIATYLNNKGILPPSSRLNFPKAKFGVWTHTGVKSILTNPKYGGKMVQHRTKKVSYKVKKIVSVNQKDWIYGDDFEGIVTKETFQEVQNLIKKRAKVYRYKGEHIHPFSSVLICNECKGPMSYRKDYEGYKCTNSQKGSRRCTAHSVKETYLKQAVISDLKELIEKVDMEDIYIAVKDLLSKKESWKDDLDKIEREIEKQDRYFKKVYLDQLNEEISPRNFTLLKDSIQKKQEKLLKRRVELIETNKVHCDENIYKEEISKYINFGDVDRPIIESFIDEIVISEDKITREKNISIYYKFRKS